MLCLAFVASLTAYVVAAPVKSSIAAKSTDYSDPVEETLPYDAEVEYLQNTGGAGYFNTGISIDDDSYEVVLDFQMTGTPLAKWAGIFSQSALNTDSSVTRLLAYLRYTGSLLGSYRRASDQTHTTISCDALVRRVYSIRRSQLKIFTNGELTNTITCHPPSGTYNPNPLTVASPDCLGRWFEFQIYHNQKLILDLIPVRFTNADSISEGAMYDLVSGELFRNQGTGSFLIGPDIE